MSKRITGPIHRERLRGMMLLSAYGDALGADHETNNAIHPAPFPKQLPQQTLDPEPDKWGYWVTTNELDSTAKGVTTDDTAFKLFLLHPWLQQILVGDSQLGETAFVEFISELKLTTLQPDWIGPPRNAQIVSWLDMYRASEVPEASEFFAPNVPIVFGLFLFLELAAIRTQYDPVENYRYFRNATVLDQGYASTATGFLTAITSLAFSSDPSQPSERFDRWLVDQSMNLIDELNSINLDHDEVATIQRIVTTMSELGEQQRGRSPHDFMVAFEETVITPHNPPFMSEPFAKPVHDPFRMLAEMYAAATYAEGDPYKTMRAVAFGSGDSDTVSAFLGTLQGIWFGEQRLRENSYLNEGFEIIEEVLKTTFQIDLNQHVDLFLNLQGESGSASFV